MNDGVVRTNPCSGGELFIHTVITITACFFLLFDRCSVLELVRLHRKNTFDGRCSWFLWAGFRSCHSVRIGTKQN